jgi:hypothetical protein
MAKQMVVVRAVRSIRHNKKIDRAIKDGGFSSPIAFIRAAIDSELTAR